MADSKTATPPEAPDYPKWWSFDDDGTFVEGSFVRMDRAYTANGEKPFVVLRVNDTERTIWLLHDVLRNGFAREVHRRPDKTIHVGEKVQIWRLEARDSQTNAGRSYTDYKVLFLDGPVPMQTDIIGPPPEASKQSQPETEGTTTGGGMPSDDVPFA